ncbi:unnamed protein product, partial [Adineta steineri]
MSFVVISLFLVGIVSLILFFTGCIDVGINFLIHRAYERHKQTRWNQRPSRIFLVRHGESEANVDT